MKAIEKTTLEVEPARSYHDDGFTSWLCVHGETVAYLSYRLEDGEVIARTLEVRLGFHGQGYARAIVEQTVAHHGGSQAYHIGGFTPDGFNARHLFTRPEHVGPARVEYQSMTFIHDWQTRTTHDRYCGCE